MDGIQLLVVIIIAIAVTGLAHRHDRQAPLVVVTVGLLASFIPGLPRLELEPDVILGVVVPPLIYSTALNLSVRSFARNLGPILRLGVGMVLITAFAVAGVAAWAVPGLTFAAAFVLGAVVAPPDAVTAVAIGRTLGVPKRVMTILTGESLVNDAAALTLFSVGVSAITGDRNLFRNPLLFFGYSAAVGVLVGLLLGVLVQWLRVRLDDPGLETVLGLVVPFAAYLTAEELHASGVLAVVLAGFWLGHNSAEAGFATRLQERQVWRSLDVLLETFVFAYMGLQLRFVIDDVRAEGEPLGRLIGAAVLVLLVVMAIRPAWIFLARGLRLLGRQVLGQRVLRRARSAQPSPATANQNEGSWKNEVVIGWTGMRGVVTLAAASGLPLSADGNAFPGRDAIQFVAFVVAVGTLLIQGVTLPWLVGRLNLSTAAEEAQEQVEHRRAQDISRTASEQAAKDFLADPPAGVDPAVLSGIGERLRAAQETRAEFGGTDDRDQRRTDRTGQPGQPGQAERHGLGAAIGLLRARMLSAQRSALVRERDAGTLDDEVLRDVLEQLDYEEAATSARIGSRL